MNLPRLVLGLVRFLEESGGIAVAIATQTIQALMCPTPPWAGEENAIMVERDFPLLLF